MTNSQITTQFNDTIIIDKKSHFATLQFFGRTLDDKVSQQIQFPQKKASFCKYFKHVQLKEAF